MFSATASLLKEECGIDNHLILAIAFAIVAIINGGYLLYKSNEMNKQNEGQSHGKKS